MRRHQRFLLLGIIGTALLASACSSSEPGDEGRVRVVTSLPLLAEFAARVGGEDATVSSIVPLGVDEHSYTPSTSSARDITQADLLLVNGYGLEQGLLPLITNNAREGVPVIPVARGLAPLEADDHDHDGDGEQDHAAEDHVDEVPVGLDPLIFAEGDPHFWLDVANAIAYVNTIRDALIQVDAAHEAGYTERAAAFVAELQALDTEVRALTASIPAEARRIVVFHNAFEYFAHAYGFEVFESVAPANPNQAASAQEVAAIIRSVREAGVPALYAEPQFSAQTLEAIAAETGTRVLTLYSIPAEGATSYGEMMRANARALAEGLGGG
ncbi:MAG: metal ABC transporter substrate-binding protein [Dehalococcoidia bacterium]|nr:metal ABC transporter substrate-binding protein [Dehalococcoidia bacterium]